MADSVCALLSDSSRSRYAACASSREEPVVLSFFSVLSGREVFFGTQTVSPASSESSPASMPFSEISASVPSFSLSDTSVSSACSGSDSESDSCSFSGSASVSFSAPISVSSSAANAANSSVSGCSSVSGTVSVSISASVSVSISVSC